MMSILAGLQLISAAASAGGESTRTAASRKDSNGVTRSLYNVSYVVGSENSEGAAREYLQASSSLLKVQEVNSTLRTDRVITHNGISHVRFTQLYSGIPVYRGDVVVSVNARSEIGMVVNNFRNDIQLPSTTPLFTASEAVNKGRRHLNVQGRSIGKDDDAALMAYKTDKGAGKLVYRVSITAENPAGDWELLIDATSGEVLRVEDRFVMYDGEKSRSGHGYAYLSSPLGAAHQVYGSPGFVDNNNADSDSLNAYRSLVPLDSLAFEDDVWKLKGPYCNVTDIESPEDPPFFAEASADSFRYTRSQPGFDAVMAYYHVTGAYTRLLDLGFAIPTLAQLRIDPHGFQGKDNSHYSPSGNWISLGTGGIHDAQDADVIWHEYGHAIIYNIVPSWGGGESGPLGEGFGDYWAASHSRSLRQWSPADPQYNWLFVWDGHNPYWSGRILNDSHTYPFGNLSIHAAGQIWSSALMGIREDLGRDITDKLVLTSLFYLGSEVTATDNAQAIIQADRDLYDGTHIPTLVYWLGTVKHFMPQSDTAKILVVNDESPGSQDSLWTGNKGVNVIFDRTGLHGSARHFVEGAVPDGYQMQTTTFAGLDTNQLADFRAIILAAGLNATPFNDAAKRSALVQYALQGGKVLAEGGEVGYFYRKQNSGEVDAEFRHVILHDSVFVDDGPSAALLCSQTQHPLLNCPYQISGMVSFTQRSTYADRDIVLPASCDPSVSMVGTWSTDPGSAGIIVSVSKSDARTVFFPFAVASITDSTTAAHLVDNAIAFLLRAAAPTTTSVNPSGELLPGTIALGQNYPNPFNPATTIVYQLPALSEVRLKIYDILGREVSTLVEGVVPAGSHQAVWNASTQPAIASGFYVYRMEVKPLGGNGTVVLAKKMLLVK